MDTYPPTDTTASRLTSEAVLAACEEANVTVTKAQLSRWARAGLLEHPVSEGRGQGKGWRWLWPADTPARVILIARALRPQASLNTSSPRGRSLDFAADALMYKGYAPRADVLRARLRAFADGVERDAKHRQTYLADETLSEEERRLKFLQAKHTQMERFGTANGEMRNALAIFSAVSVGFTNLARYFSFQAHREALDASDPDTVTQAYVFAVLFVEALPPEVDTFFVSLIKTFAVELDTYHRWWEGAETWQDLARPAATFFLLTIHQHAAAMRHDIEVFRYFFESGAKGLGMPELDDLDATYDRLKPIFEWLFPSSNEQESEGGKPPTN